MKAIRLSGVLCLTSEITISDERFTISTGIATAINAVVGTVFLLP